MKIINWYIEFCKKVIMFPIVFFTNNKYKTSTKIIVSVVFFGLIILVSKKQPNKTIESQSSSTNNVEESNSSNISHTCKHCGKSFQGKGYAFAFNTYIIVNEGQGNYCSGYCASEHNKHR